MILRIDLSHLGKRSVKRPVINIRPQYAIDSGLLKVDNKNAASAVLYKYGRAVAKYLESGEVYRMSGSSKDTYIGISGVQMKYSERTVRDIMNAMGEKFDLYKYVLEPRMKVMIVENSFIAKERFNFSDERKIRDILNKLPVNKRNQFPKE